MRREYPLKLIFNGRTLGRVIIDSHYEDRHRASIDDDLILTLVKIINGEERIAEAVAAGGFEIFRIDPVFYNDKTYRLVLTLPPKSQDNADYLGVINAFRVHERKRKQRK
jgi:hypothetical protein